MGSYSCYETANDHLHILHYERYIVLAPKEAMFPEPVVFGCTTCVFEALIPDDLIARGEVLEGESVVIGIAKVLAQQKYAWGTGNILRDYLTETGEESLMDSYIPDYLSSKVEQITSSNVQELANDPWARGFIWTPKRAATHRM